MARELARGDQADAAVGAGDDRAAPGLVGDVVSGPGHLRRPYPISAAERACKRSDWSARRAACCDAADGLLRHVSARVVLFAAVSVLWGIPYLFIKLAVEDLSPVMVAFGPDRRRVRRAAAVRDGTRARCAGSASTGSALLIYSRRRDLPAVAADRLRRAARQLRARRDPDRGGAADRRADGAAGRSRGARRGRAARRPGRSASPASSCCSGSTSPGGRASCSGRSRSCSRRSATPPGR